MHKHNMLLGAPARPEPDMLTFAKAANHTFIRPLGGRSVLSRPTRPGRDPRRSGGRKQHGGQRRELAREEPLVDRVPYGDRGPQLRRTTLHFRELLIKRPTSSERADWQNSASPISAIKASFFEE